MLLGGAVLPYWGFFVAGFEVNAARGEEGEGCSNAGVSCRVTVASKLEGSGASASTTTERAEGFGIAGMLPRYVPR